MFKTISGIFGMKRMSVRFKINLSVALIFVTVAVVTTVYSYQSERQHMLDRTIEDVKDMTTFYFDSLNTLMLVGAMDQRTILRDKILRRPGALVQRVCRQAARHGDGDHRLRRQACVLRRGDERHHRTDQFRGTQAAG